MLDNGVPRRTIRGVEVAEQFASPETLDDLLVIAAGRHPCAPSSPAAQLAAGAGPSAATCFRRSNTWTPPASGAPASRAKDRGSTPAPWQNQSRPGGNQAFTAAQARMPADRAHLCRDRHPRSVRARPRNDPQARRGSRDLRLRNSGITIIRARGRRAAHDINVGSATARAPSGSPR